MNGMKILRLAHPLAGFAAGPLEQHLHRLSHHRVLRGTLPHVVRALRGAGRAVAQSTRIPIHLNSMSVCLDDIVAGHIPLDDWNDGDIILTKLWSGETVADPDTDPAVYADENFAFAKL